MWTLCQWFFVSNDDVNIRSFGYALLRLISTLDGGESALCFNCKRILKFDAASASSFPDPEIIDTATDDDEWNIVSWVNPEI